MDEMVRVFGYTIQFVKESVEDLTEEEMVGQPPGVPNHATWTLGHLIFCCQGMAIEVGGGPWLPHEWESKFGYGSIPSGRQEEYQTKSEMLALLDNAAGRLVETLRTADAPTLHRVLEDETFPTMLDLLLQMKVHILRSYLSGKP